MPEWIPWPKEMLWARLFHSPFFHCTVCLMGRVKRLEERRFVNL